jgi:hypothetical protein
MSVRRCLDLGRCLESPWATADSMRVPSPTDEAGGTVALLIATTVVPASSPGNPPPRAEGAHPRLPGRREADEVRERERQDLGGLTVPTAPTPRPSLLPLKVGENGGAFFVAPSQPQQPGMAERAVPARAHQGKAERTSA